MLEWLLLAWIWTLGVITGCFIRQCVYMNKARYIKQKYRGKRK